MGRNSRYNPPPPKSKIFAKANHAPEGAVVPDDLESEALMEFLTGLFTRIRRPMGSAAALSYIDKAFDYANSVFVCSAEAQEGPNFVCDSVQMWWEKGRFSLHLTLSRRLSLDEIQRMRERCYEAVEQDSRGAA